MITLPNSYSILLKDIKKRIQYAQVRVAFKEFSDAFRVYVDMSFLKGKLLPGYIFNTLNIK
jgi:hypothetical protein